MGLEISNFLTFPLTSSSICWWRNFFDKLQGLATIWRQSRQVSNFAYMKNRKVIPMPNFEQQIIWSDVKFEFRMISAFIWYTYCWYVTKNDQVLIFTYRSLHFVNVVKVVIGFNDITNVNNVNDVVTVNDINGNNNNYYYYYFNSFNFFNGIYCFNDVNDNVETRWLRRPLTAKLNNSGLCSKALMIGKDPSYNIYLGCQPQKRPQEASEAISLGGSVRPPTP